MEQRWLFFSFLFLLLLFAFRVFFFFSLLGFVVALFLTFLGFRVRERTDPSRMVEILSIILYIKGGQPSVHQLFSFVRSLRLFIIPSMLCCLSVYFLNGPSPFLKIF